MKNYSYLILLVILLAFFTGQLTYQFKEDRVPQKSEIIEISRALDEIVQTVQPYTRIDLNGLYRHNDFWELFRGTHYNSNSFNPPLNECEYLQFQSFENNSKFADWLNFKCRNTLELPSGFFETKPYISPHGDSFVFLAFVYNVYPFNTRGWIFNNLQFLKPIELKKIPIELNRPLEVLANFNEAELNIIIKNEKMFQANGYIFLKTGDFQYYAIKRERLNKILSASIFEISRSFNNCSFIVGNICWKYRKLSLLNQLTNKSFTTFYLSLIILLVLIIIIISKVRTANLEQEKKRHAFRILTHELRTPISSLLLIIERLTKDSRTLSPVQQNEILQIETEVYRLKNLASKSSTILQSDKINEFKFSFESISNIGHLISEWTNDTKITIDSTFHSPIKIDLYWFKICILNVIENAKKYGQLPIRIEINESKNLLKIKVIDQGVTQYKNIKDLIQSPRTESKGLGLGLIIVKKTLKEMGIKLNFQATPTSTFIFSIRIHK